jgi:hypothetical protein
MTALPSGLRARDEIAASSAPPTHTVAVPIDVPESVSGS